MIMHAFLLRDAPKATTQGMAESQRPHLLTRISLRASEILRRRPSAVVHHTLRQDGVVRLVLLFAPVSRTGAHGPLVWTGNAEQGVNSRA